MSRRRIRVTVRGVVQGVGFRPFVYTTATMLGLTGSVAQRRGGRGDRGRGRRRRRIPGRAGHAAAAGGRGVRRGRRGAGAGRDGIRHRRHAHGDGRDVASPDIATCDECLAELRDPANRRYRHPFINCTNCGPRFTIIASLPYDRCATAMAGFPMCAACAREYADPADRRFHAQPVCCPACGPRLARFGSLVRGGGVAGGAGVDPRRRGARGEGGRRISPGVRRRLGVGGVDAAGAEAAGGTSRSP